MSLPTRVRISLVGKRELERAALRLQNGRLFCPEGMASVDFKTGRAPTAAQHVPRGRQLTNKRVNARRKIDCRGKK